MDDREEAWAVFQGFLFALALVFFFLMVFLWFV